ncbi:hypothetical protein L3Q82_008045 [Scortum barcoo]|uniref:Uncharacterized protein n=1 Tax=Scortum barcoo TaxID=214431 RepID=A0ACB8WLK2_9TELE|nr:hypothetical protein L3Q82_008045 [Scortum barcoo]
MRTAEGGSEKRILCETAAKKTNGHHFTLAGLRLLSSSSYYLSMSSKERQESRKEVAVLANMSHPNIVQYKESFEEGGCLYIVMDYCEGGDLFRKINSQKGVLFFEEQFEAGNMKNLVLKIIRGSYPPVSVHYSQELRSLLAQLFKRNPRERPSVSSILDKPFLACRIERFLTPQIIAQEFRHNFLHKQPKMGVVQGPPAMRSDPGSIPLAPAQKITKPASKYGVPLTVRKVSDAAKKPAEKKPAVKHKPEGIRKKRMELIEKERKQREQMFLLKADQMKRYEKEKCFVGTGKRAVPSSVQSPTPAHVPSKSPYEHYHAALDQMAKPPPKAVSREGSSAGPCSPIRQRNQMAGERAYQVEEFLQRKREAMLNKVRAEGQLEYLSRLRQIRLQNFNERQQIKARLRGEKYDSDGSDSQESSEEAELKRKKIEALKAQANARAAVLKEQLEKKRKEAYEREKRAWEEHLAARGVKVGVATGNVAVAAAAVAAPSTSDSPLPQPSPSQPEPAAKAPALPASKPSNTAISMTAALKNVGATTPLKGSLPEPETATVIQSEKKQILRRLNQNLKTQSPVEEVEESPPAPTEPGPAPQQNQSDTENRPSSVGDRKKWDAAELPVLPVTQQTLEATCATTATSSVSPEDRPSSGGDRKKWEARVPLVLSVAEQTLEQTCFTTIEQTAGEVIQMAGLHDNAPRKVWGVSPDTQVLRVLQEAELQPLTQQLENVTICEEDFSSPDKPDKAAAAEIVKTSKEVFPSTPSPSAAVQSPEVQKEGPRTTEASHQEMSVATSVERVTLPPNVSETQDPADLESVVLEETPKQASRPPTGVQQAWEQQAQQPMPPEGVTKPAGTKEVEKSAEKPTESSGSAQCEEPLFMKLCSPAHRRTAALAILSAQSSMDESSSSLASRSRSVSPLRSKHHDALLIGLSTGMFDSNNPKMLRTCSLPDLSRLFSSQPDSAVTNDANVVPDNNLEIEDLEEAAKDDDQSETEDAYEDEDLRDIRASMERLLQEEVGAGDFNGNPPQGEDQELFNRIAAEINKDNNQMAVDDDDDDDEEEDDDDDEEEEEDEDEDEECSNGSPGDEEAGELLTNGVEEENHSNASQLNEEWHSDGSGEDQGGEAVHHDSIFSRLEELRFDLEQQMGFEKFIEAYNKIKAIHEDEDENIDLGSSLVFNILGTEHQHLYPNILHLVMADGAYQEGGSAGGVLIENVILKLMQMPWPQPRHGSDVTALVLLPNRKHLISIMSFC